MNYKRFIKYTTGQWHDRRISRQRQRKIVPTKEIQYQASVQPVSTSFSNQYHAKAEPGYPIRYPESFIIINSSLPLQSTLPNSEPPKHYNKRPKTPSLSLISENEPPKGFRRSSDSDYLTVSISGSTVSSNFFTNLILGTLLTHAFQKPPLTIGIFLRILFPEDAFECRLFGDCGGGGCAVLERVCGCEARGEAGSVSIGYIGAVFISGSKSKRKDNRLLGSKRLSHMASKAGAPAVALSHPPLILLADFRWGLGTAGTALRMEVETSAWLYGWFMYGELCIMTMVAASAGISSCWVSFGWLLPRRLQIFQIPFPFDGDRRSISLTGI